MSQHEIDLLPESMRAKSQARAAASRNVGIALLAAGLLAALFTHARLSANRAESRLDILSRQTQQLEATERRATDMRTQLDRYDSLLARYRRIETPLEISRLVATLSHVLPESATIDRIEIDSDRSQLPRGPRTAGMPRRPDEVEAPRVLIGEIAGFAKTDYDIAELVAALDGMPPFSGVSLDFSRQKDVNGQNAREFRLSFVVDFDANYIVHELDPESAGGGVANVE